MTNLVINPDPVVLKSRIRIRLKIASNSHYDANNLRFLILGEFWIVKITFEKLNFIKLCFHFVRFFF
jgi:hypothetical protein